MTEYFREEEPYSKKKLSETIESLQKNQLAGIQSMFGTNGHFDAISESMTRLAKAVAPLQKAQLAGMQSMFETNGHFDTISESVTRLAKVVAPLQKTQLASIQSAFKTNGNFDAISESVTRLAKAVGPLQKAQLASIQLAVNAISENMPEVLELLKNVEVSEIDWDNFEPITEEKIVTYKESNKDMKSNYSNNFLVSWIVFVFMVIGHISNSITVLEFAETRIYPTVQSLSHKVFNSDKEAIKYINNELKQNIETHIVNNFRIVTKDDLIVREGRRIDSAIKGKLNSKNIVQIIEKKKNWTYISYSDFESKEFIEGWVFTRYLKKIK